MCCIGLKIAYADGKVLSFIGNALKKLYDKGGIYSYIAMSLGVCHYCMSSLYSISFHVCLGFVGYAGSSLLLPAIILIVCFLNGVFYGLLGKLDKHFNTCQA